MRAGVFITLGLMAVVWTSQADEKLPVLKVGRYVYTNVIVRACPQNVSF